MNTEFIVQQKNGVNQISFLPPHKAEAKPFGFLDATLVVAFMAAFVGLVFLLAH
jgi:hypothetical protein